MSDTATLPASSGEELMTAIFGDVTIQHVAEVAEEAIARAEAAEQALANIERIATTHDIPAVLLAEIRDRVRAWRTGPPGPDGER